MPKIEPDWLLQKFADALDAPTQRKVEQIITQSLANAVDGGVLVERNYSIADIANAMKFKRQPVAVIPFSEVSIMPSVDVPTGRIHHVLHFNDGDVRMFSRLFVEDRNV